MNKFNDKRKISITNLNEKHVFQYVFKNELFDTPIVYFVDDSIKSIYKYCKFFYDEKNKKPNKNNIKIEFGEEQYKIIELLFNYSEYDSECINDVWGFENEFKINKNIINKNIETLNSIEKARDWKQGKDIEITEDEYDEIINDEDDKFEEKKSDLELTPFIEDSVYENLPQTIKEMTTYFDNKRFKDVYLTSFLTIISAYFDNFYILDKFSDEYSLNLYSFIVAPPASGKSTTKKAEQTIGKYNYYRDIEITPDSSSAAFFDQLYDNQGLGLMVVDEADILINVNKQDWGNYDQKLRSIHDNQNIKENRKKTKERVEPNRKIIDPKLSILLSGTLNQPINLFKTRENGLVSRFLFYIFKGNGFFQEGRVKYNSKEVFFNKFGDIIEHVIKKYNKKEPIPEIYSDDLFDVDTNNDSRILVDINKKQFKIIDDLLKKQLEKTKVLLSENYKDIIMRNFIRFMRIIGILSIFEYYDNNQTIKNNKIIASDNVFNIALSLIDTYDKHTQLMFNSLQDDSMKDYENSPKIKLLALLNNKFTMKDVKDIITKYEIKIKLDKNIYRIINELKTNKQIEKLKRGLYRKII